MVSRQRPVPDGIKQASLVPELAQAARDYYEDMVLKDMNPFRKDDVLSQLVKVIKEDKEIGDKKRDELLDYYNNGQEGRFLGEVFLYVVNRPNKPGEDFVGFEDAPLIAEANYECPICHKKLVDTVKNKPIKRYVITHIFPERLSKDKTAELAAVYPKPKDLEQTDNLIALCDHCAEDYLSDPTVEEYKGIYELKRGLARNYKAKESVNEVDLEEDIRIVLDALTNVDDSVQLVPLEYEALHIDEKFDLDAFSRHMNMSKYHFCRRFKEEFSCTPLEYVQQQKINKAKRILTFTTLPVSEIAYSLAFCDQSHFCRVFTKNNRDPAQ